MSTTLILNFGHPLTPGQLEQLQVLVGVEVQERHVPLHVPPGVSLVVAARELLDSVGFSSQEWQGQPFVVVPPGLSPLAVVLLAELHGRCGHFPAVVVVRPVVGAAVPAFEVAEVVNLQGVRDMARQGRVFQAE